MPASTVWNVPNRLSALRVVIALVMFVTLTYKWYYASLALFVAGAITDYVDGWWARRYQQITQLGRVLDPFADKLLVCGAFIMLCAVPESRVQPWMAVVITGRELLVTALRSFSESRDVDFSARWAGKWKMVAQCAALILAMWLPAAGGDLFAYSQQVTDILLWITVALTLWSGWGYVRLAAEMLRHG